MISYLLLITLFFVICLFLFFNKRLNFKRRLKHLLLPTLLCVLVFLPWEIGMFAIRIFESKPGVWNYPQIVPLERIMNALTMPSIAIFTYYSSNKLLPKDWLRRMHFSLTPILAIALFLLLIYSVDQTFTALSSAFLIFLLLIQLIKLKRYMGYFFISVLPWNLFIVAISLISVSVFTLNPTSTIHLKFLGIDVEYFIYYTSFYLLAILGFEWSRKISSKRVKTEVANPNQ